MKTLKAQPRQLSPQLQKLDSKLRQASQMYEKQFLREMVKAMRRSVDHSALTKPGMAENIYREQLDDQYVDDWVARGGTGFGDMVYQELVNKFYPQLGPRKVKKLRPINLSDRFQGVSRQLTQSKNKQSFNIQLAAQAKTQSYLQIPWQGKLEKEFTLENGQKVALFSHPFDLKSTFVFQGQLEPGLLNKTLAPGENFARVGPESQSLTWQIEKEDSRKGSPEGGKKPFN
jgi:flagellar protein FlgJ